MRVQQTTLADVLRQNSRVDCTRQQNTRCCKASNVGRGWNFTWDGQAGLGHPPWEGGGSPRMLRSAKQELWGFLEGSERPGWIASANF